MAFSVRQDAAPISGINVTPLVDVLLVLLIIFMISAPVIAHKASVDLPAGGARPPSPAMEPIDITIEGGGMTFWNHVLVTDATLVTQMDLLGAREGEKPSLHISASDDAPYEDVAKVLAEAKVHGLSKIDFVNR
ncbi:MAG: biopolymer transporter ExbD [Luteibacter sp.]